MQTITIRAFPILAIFFTLLAIIFPQWFTPFSAWILLLLGVIMFTMGMTLHVSDFLRVLKMPIVIAIGVGMQFLLMPLLGWGLAWIFQLPALLAAGLILVGSCPGGTASNVICFLSQGNVALSVTLTAVSTLLAFLATPFLTWFYVGQSVDVPVLNMLLSILKIVLFPVLAGVVINTYFGHHLERVKPVLPILSVLTIVFVIAIVTALNANNLMQLTSVVVIAVLLHNLLGLAAGYFIARFIGYDLTTARTLAIEVGMQNSGLGTALAVKYFGAAAALPGALFSIWHNVSGAILAQYWIRKKQNL
ncbi:bile acid:sodium symporter family protein [Candidatus Parabeggiatoa sp. HSG14]|uniref:bile acid:sodium symporter family protein n=1 Tax=Candidatus Parabeggiatoa sp. HSG14 TaxID=3055593 RepID=UPI0025A8DD23|nr:bile acid:sodium symporter family protein [Thiotrichales bacterium HSG14]